MKDDYSIKKGFSERLILPMGTDHERFIILYAANNDPQPETYGGQFDHSSLYMAVYDRTKTSYPGIEQVGAVGGTLLDISERDYDVEAPEVPEFYQVNSPDVKWASNVQLAATELIDNCHFFVYVFEGAYLLRYKLSDQGFEYDNHYFLLDDIYRSPQTRSEMELVQLSNGDYRLACPSGNKEIHIIDIDGVSGDVIPQSQITIDLGVSGSPVQPYGLEFDPTGQYLYYTHETNSNFPNKLDIFDVNAETHLSVPTLSGFSDFQKSYIETDGQDLYLASDDYLGKLENVSNPTSAPNLSFDDQFQQLNNGYGNGLSSTDNPSSTLFRYLLPEQLDMPYPDLANFSCESCNELIESQEQIIVSQSDSWTPGSNPLTSGGSEVYVRDELRIESGAALTISGMTFYFGPDAKVVVERGSMGNTGGALRLTNGTVFTADHRCANQTFIECGEEKDCDKDLWQGVRVYGLASVHDQSSSGSDEHGFFSMSENSMIEYARTAVLAGHDTQTGYGGGLVIIGNSRIKDNIDGVVFQEYIRYINGTQEASTYSTIYNSHLFTSNEWIMDYEPNHLVRVESYSGLNLKGNLCENQIPTQFWTSDRGIGLLIQDSKVRVDYFCDAGSSQPITCPTEDVVRSEFKNLQYGVYGLNSGMPNRTFYGYYSLFTNNFTGIYLSNFINPELLDNEFEVAASSDASGVYLTSSTGYMVENNSFTSYEEGNIYSGNFGIVVNSSGPANNDIYRNNFQNISVGGFALNNNANTTDLDQGLTWTCNTFDFPISNADIALNGTMSDNQGLCSGNAAGNLFSHSSSSHTYHHGLFAASGSTVDIEYKHHNIALSNEPRLKPLVYTGQSGAPFHYQVNPCSSQVFDGRSCPEMHSGAPVTGDDNPGPESGAGPEGGMNYTSLNNQFSEMQVELNGLSAQESNGEYYAALAEYEDLWNNAISFYMADTTGALPKADMQELLITYQPEVAQRFASALLEEGSQEWISSENQYNPATAPDMPLPALNEQDSLPEYLPEYFDSGFFDMAHNTAELNSLYIENGQIYHPHIGIDWPEFDGGAEGKSQNPDISDEGTKTLVKPNPFSDRLTFDLSELELGKQAAKITFYDITGRMVKTVNVKPEQSALRINTADLPQGLLNFTITSNGKRVDMGKVVHTK
jgi:hypothetical protein